MKKSWESNISYTLDHMRGIFGSIVSFNALDRLKKFEEYDNC